MPKNPNKHIPKLLVPAKKMPASVPPPPVPLHSNPPALEQLPAHPILTKIPPKHPHKNNLHNNKSPPTNETSRLENIIPIKQWYGYSDTVIMEC